MSQAQISPATELPPLRQLHRVLEQLLLAEYMMDCTRCGPDVFFPRPPQFSPVPYVEPGSTDEKFRITCVLTGIRRCYTHIQYMLAEEVATESEKDRIANMPLVILMKNFLPDISWENIIRIPAIPLASEEHTYMVRECRGMPSDDDSVLFFIGEDNRNKFIAYMNARKTVNSNV